MKNLALRFALLLGVVAVASDFGAAQAEPSPTPTAAERRAQELQTEIDALRKQLEYEKSVGDISQQRIQQMMRAIGSPELRGYDGKTEYSSDNTPSPEAVALSYVALKELSAKVSELMKPHLAGYSRLVIYNEPDFLGLARYRMFRAESEAAFRNYDLVAKNAADLRILAGSRSGGEEVGAKGLDPFTTALSLPSIGASYARSVGDLFSVFRTDTRITESTATVGDLSFGSVFANELERSTPGVRIYFPGAFVPEYDLDVEGDGSLIVQIAKLDEAAANLADFVKAGDDIPASQKSRRGVSEALSLATLTQRQFKTLSTASDALLASGTKGETAMSAFREMLRAEKLDRFLRGDNSRSISGPAGILKLRVLASGGSRRETRNLFMGNKIAYSGSAVIEVLLFDIDGTLRKSEVFSHHTGFRKMKKADER